MPLSKLSPCLWFDSNAEEAVKFYTSIFKNSKIGDIGYYGEAGREHHGREPGSVCAIYFELDGQSFTALNGGPLFKFNEAISLQIDCADQAEVDYYWEKLNEGGDPSCQACGWLKDKFGVSWQVVPSMLPKLFVDPDTVASQRMLTVMHEMKKLDIAKLQAAFDGR
ncbi:VOC family protein [Haloferula sp. BvORR071]|uniref:VOC family protein n=1 Tax=Haloferula sp. BvORR071 TaxID=1396141 RepID=UPI000556B318|nr:VOC family protein [Haloferula sp. BvORR071]